MAPASRHDVARSPQHAGDGEVEASVRRARCVLEVVGGLELLGADAGEAQRVPGTDAVGRRQLLVDADLQLLVEVGRAALDDPRVAHAVQHPAVRGAERVEVAEAGGVRPRRIVGHEEEVLPARRRPGSPAGRRARPGRRSEPTATALPEWKAARKRSMAVDVRCHAEIAKMEVPPPIAMSATSPSQTRHRRRS